MIDKRNFIGINAYIKSAMCDIGHVNLHDVVPNIVSALLALHWNFDFIEDWFYKKAFIKKIGDSNVFYLNQYDPFDLPKNPKAWISVKEYLQLNGINLEEELKKFAK